LRQSALRNTSTGTPGDIDMEPWTKTLYVPGLVPGLTTVTLIHCMGVSPPYIKKMSLSCAGSPAWYSGCSRSCPALRMISTGMLLLTP